jgi:hypothetical protein
VSYRSLFKIDPWPDDYPLIENLSCEELCSILDNAPYAYLSSWEQDFCESIKDQLESGRELSERQLDVFNRGLFHRLVDNDPDLWGLYPLGLFKIQVDYDKITIEGVEVKRPYATGAKEWIDFWEMISSLDYLNIEVLEKKIKDLESELKFANKEIEDLRSAIRELRKD